MAGTMTFTILGTTPVRDGMVRKRVKAVGDAAYPVAGYPVTAANCGLKMFAVNATGDGFIDPVVTGVNQKGVLAEVVSGKLLISYSTGGAATSPTTPAAPVGLCASGAATASAVDATRPTVGLTPGQGKAFADNSDASGLTFFLDAIGYPA